MREDPSAERPASRKRAREAGLKVENRADQNGRAIIES